ncbi:hypothetical protein C8R43DRAFT_869245, partial [Mycena crocata]
MSTTPTNDLSTELWEEIFAQLPRETLSHVCIATRRFHRLASPLLFRELEFHPYKLLRGFLLSTSFGIPDAQHIDLVLQRLRFWSTEKTAPFVRACRV